MRSLVLALVVVGGVEAQAKCGDPGGFVLPTPGSPLPANPTLYFFTPGAGTAADPPKPRAVTQTGQTLALRVSELKTIGTLSAWKLSVTAPRNTRFSIQGISLGTLGKETEPAVGPWTTDGEVANESLVLKRGEDVVLDWSCSHTALRVLSSSIDAPAYRVEFAPTKEGLEAGKSTPVVVQGRNDSAYSAARFFKQALPPRPSQVELGYFSCVGSNFTEGAVAIRVTALMPDGTERPSRDVFVLEKLASQTREPEEVDH